MRVKQPKNIPVPACSTLVLLDPSKRKQIDPDDPGPREKLPLRGGLPHWIVEASFKSLQKGALQGFTEGRDRAASVLTLQSTVLLSFQSLTLVSK